MQDLLRNSLFLDGVTVAIIQLLLTIFSSVALHILSLRLVILPGTHSELLNLLVIVTNHRLVS